MTSQIDIIIFGGTFDPPHAGHVACVRQAVTAFPDAEIYVIPAGVPASAGGSHKAPSSSFEERLKLSELAFSSISPKVHVSDIEGTMPAPNFTFLTLRELKERLPHNSFGLMIGMDQFKSFLKWKAPFEILANANLIVVTRPDVANTCNASFKEIKAEIEAAYNSHEPNAAMKPIYHLDGETSPASSTTLRYNLATETKVPEGWLQTSVLDFIKTKHLYEDKD